MNDSRRLLGKRNPVGQAGVVLIEVLVGVLVFSIGILAIVGLQAFAVEQVSDAKYRLDASMIANQYIGRMWVDQANLGNYVTADQALAELPDGKLTITVVGTSEVTVTVAWMPPHSGVEHTFSQVARINPAGG